MKRNQNVGACPKSSTTKVVRKRHAVIDAQIHNENGDAIHADCCHESRTDRGVKFARIVFMSAQTFAVVWMATR